MKKERKTMRRLNIIYWSLTGLLAAFMAMSAMGQILMTPESVELVSVQLGYPVYFNLFLGTAKLLGAVALLIPGFPRIKEWVYAGFFFDLIAAMYSFYSVGAPASEWLLPMIGFIVFVAICYMVHHRKLKQSIVEDAARPIRAVISEV